MSNSDVPDSSSPLNRFFSKTEAVAGAAPKGRHARKPKVRHDISDEAPIDGDYRPLELVNTDKNFEYPWLTEADRGSVGAGRGYEPVLWSADEKAVRPKYYFGKRDVGTEIRQRELTLHRVPAERMARIRAGESKRHNDMARMLFDKARNSGPKGRAEIVTTHQVTV